MEEDASSDLSETELQNLERSARPDATIRATNYGVRKFNEWLRKRSKSCDFMTVSAEDLNQLLRKFYAEVKPAKQGGSLSASTLTGLRAAIHRNITGAPYNRPLNIIKDREFVSANKMFTARCKLYVKTGNKKPQHKPPIGDGDMSRLGKYFSQWNDNPDVLVEAVWFFLCFYFGRRGREGWAKMTQDTFGTDTDSEGHDFVFMKTTEVTKNHQGGHKQADLDYSDQRMYGPGVDIFRFYLSKCSSKNHRLFQTPLKAFKSDGEWYRNEPMGKNTLATMMQKISNKAGLSQTYTCHSVRASTVTILYQAGISTQSIIAVTKHKNTTSLGHYIQDISEKQKRELCGVLTSALTNEKPCTVTASKASLSNEAVFSDDKDEDTEIGNFDLGYEFWNDDIQEEKAQTDAPPVHQKDGASTSMPVLDIAANADGTISLPPPQTHATGAVFNVEIPRHPLRDATNDIHSNIMSNATFHGCTINFQLKQQ